MLLLRLGPAAPFSAATQNGWNGIDSAGDNGNGGKRSKGRVTIDPLAPFGSDGRLFDISEFRVRGPSGANDELSRSTTTTAPVTR